MKLSVVATLYKSAEHLEEFVRRAKSSAEKLAGTSYEIVLVNDGSPDDSLAKAIALQEADPRIVVIDLSRNFGHHRAMMTGLTYARGDLIFLIDTDLEEEPELLLPFFARMEQGDCDVVYGVQEERRGGLLARMGGKLFYSLASFLSDQKIPPHWVVTRLMTRAYVRALVRHRDREFMLGHLLVMSGFRQIGMPVNKTPRATSSYTPWNRLHMATRYLTTTSTKLLYLTLYGGTLIWLLSIAVIVYLIIRYIFTGILVSGWTSVIVSLWFFGGLTTLILGLLGVYIATILSETKRRPYTIVRQVHRAGRD